MSKILKLSNDTIGQIAAGEVVERPAAAIKELVENSVDAGASGITVEIKDGGLTFFRVIDNGCGIAPEDLVMAFERHATSKLHSSDDLFRVATLGFRGEALASIAAVGRVTLHTRTKDAEHGMRVENEGGSINLIQEAACAQGTTITVRDLFFNVPVRQKFMKKPSLEATQVAELMRLMILSHPEISFRFVSDGKTIYFSAGDGKTDSAVMSIYGLSSLRQMKKVDAGLNGVLIHGLVGVGDLSKGNRSHESFFINGRALRSPILSSALEDACRQRVMIGRFPMCVLYLQIPYHLVDVNVHPNKWEARFSDEQGLKDAVFTAVSDALSGGAAQNTPPPFFFSPEADKKAPLQLSREVPLPAQSPDLDLPAAPAPVFKVMSSGWEQVKNDLNAPGETFPTSFAPKQEFRADDSGQAPFVQEQIFSADEELPLPEQVLMEDPLIKHSQVRMIGSAFHTYILFEYEQMLILCDQHALHERLMYEKLKKAHQSGEAAQQLLAPLAIHLGFKEYGTFLEHQALLASIGFDAEDFGEQTVRLHSLPLILGQPEAESSFVDALDLLDEKGSYQQDRMFDRLVQSACKHAVKGGERLSDEVLTGLVRDMLTEDVMPTCPHGRPLMIQMTKYDIEKRFGRVQG